MANKILLKRGLRASLPILQVGEPGFATDTYELFIGTADGNIKVGNLNGYLTEEQITALLSGKVDKVAGKGLSTNDYTTTEKNKLAGIAAGAQVNSVTSVAGKTGAVALTKGDVGLGNVTNTSDADKPVSTAQATALAQKADKSYVDAQVSSIPKFNVKVVSALPTTNISNSTIYVVDSVEYIRTGSTWQKLGSFDVDITGYAKQADVVTGLNGKVDKNTSITAGTKTKITYDAKGLVTGGADLVASDIPTLTISKITGLESELASKITASPADVVSNVSDFYVAYKPDCIEFEFEATYLNEDSYAPGGVLLLATENNAGLLAPAEKTKLAKALINTDTIDGGTW